MKPWSSWVVLVVFTACAHAKTTGSGGNGASDTKQAKDSGSSRATSDEKKASSGQPTDAVNKATKPAPNAPPIAASPQGILKAGAVRQIQTALTSAGLSTPKTGALDDKTRAQLTVFQKKKNLADTGLPDRETLHELGLDPDAILKNVNSQ